MFQIKKMRSELLFSKILGVCWIIIVSYCSFWIVFNAQWLIGDDAIIMSHTGSGIPFSPSGTLFPEKGRFFPFAYLIYDLLLPFTHGYLSAATHYWIHLILYVVFCAAMAILFVSIFKLQKPVWRYSISLLASFVIAFRIYPDYLNCFSTIWCSYSLLGVFLLFSWLFLKYHKNVYAIVALVIINYVIYCLECEFVIPLTLGVCGILFLRKKDPKSQWFYWVMSVSGLLYLIIYGIMVIPHIESIYDGAHGTGESFWGNAIHQIIGNKIIILAIIVAIIRCYDILKNRDEYTFFDSLLIAAAGYCCACFILRLNWTMYYNLAAVLAIPSIVYYCYYYFKLPVTLAILIAFLALYGYKLPRTVKYNQAKRTEVVTEMDKLVCGYRDGKALIWFAPEAEYNWDVELRSWREECLREYIQWMTKDPSFGFVVAREYSNEKSGIWLEADENVALFPDSPLVESKGTRFFSSGGIRGYLIDE